VQIQPARSAEQHEAALQSAAQVLVQKAITTKCQMMKHSLYFLAVLLKINPVNPKKKEVYLW
jgi:hypothetical protein